MKRDMELVRTILLQVENDDRSLDIEGYESSTVEKHFELLVEAGLLKANIKHTGDGSLIFLGTPRLSWEGYEFLDAARNDTIWKKAKKTLEGTTSSISFAVLKALLTQLALSELGLK
jgi:hypothetical protein